MQVPSELTKRMDDLQAELAGWHREPQRWESPRNICAIPNGGCEPKTVVSSWTDEFDDTPPGGDEVLDYVRNHTDAFTYDCPRVSPAVTELEHTSNAA